MSNVIPVNFRGDTIFATEMNGQVYVAVKPINDTLGLDWSRQARRLKDDPVLSKGMVTMPIPSVGGTQQTVCLKMEYINGWLFKIEPRRIKDAIVRAKVVAYQEECYQALFEHFYGKIDQVIEDEDGAKPEAVRCRLVTEARQTFGVKAAGQLWMRLGLPEVPAMFDDPAQHVFDFSKIKTIDAKAVS